MFSKQSILTALTTLLATTSASPLFSRATTHSTSATMTTYFVDSTCSSMYNKAEQPISTNKCMDLGEPGTTRSISLSNLNSEAEGQNCMVKVWTDQSCGVQMMTQVPLKQGNTTCVEGPDGQSTKKMGSAMLVC